MTVDDIPPLTENEERVLNAMEESFQRSRQLFGDDNLDQLGMTNEELAQQLGMTEDEVHEAPEGLIRRGYMNRFVRCGTSLSTTATSSSATTPTCPAIGRCARR